jgi:hypothetical protein
MRRSTPRLIVVLLGLDTGGARREMDPLQPIGFRSAEGQGAPPDRDQGFIGRS